MRGGQVWTQKTPLESSDPAARSPAPEGASADSLDGVPPIDNAPAASPAAPSLTPADADDFFRQQPQAWWIDPGRGLWEEQRPLAALVLGLLTPLPVVPFQGDVPSSSRRQPRLGRQRR